MHDCLVLKLLDFLSLDSLNSILTLGNFETHTSASIVLTDKRCVPSKRMSKEPILTTV